MCLDHHKELTRRCPSPAPFARVYFTQVRKTKLLTASRWSPREKQHGYAFLRSPWLLRAKERTRSTHKPTPNPCVRTLEGGNYARSKEDCIPRGVEWPWASSVFTEVSSMETLKGMCRTIVGCRGGAYQKARGCHVHRELAQASGRRKCVCSTIWQSPVLPGLPIL